MARLFSKKRAGSAHGGRPRYTETVTFDDYGLSTSVSTAANIQKMLADLDDVLELGKPGVQYDSTAGNATLTITVPTGKYWRLLSLAYSLTTDANVADRYVTCLPSDSTPTAYCGAVSLVRAESGTLSGAFTFDGGDGEVVGDQTGANGTTMLVGPGTCGAAGAFVHMATNPSNGDTVTIAGHTYTFQAELVDAANNIHIGAAVANTQTNLVNALEGLGGGTPGTDYYTSQVAHPHVVLYARAFDESDDLLVIGRYSGTWIQDTVLYPMAETFTAEADHVHAFADGADYQFPTSGGYLEGGEKVVIAVTDGVAGDTLKTWLTYLEFDSDPRP